MEKIKWPEKITDEEARKRIDEKRKLINNILCREVNCAGQIVRRNCLFFVSRNSCLF